MATDQLKKLEEKFQKLRAEIVQKKLELRKVMADLEAARPHRIGPSGIESEEKLGNIGGK